MRRSAMARLRRVCPTVLPLSAYSSPAGSSPNDAASFAYLMMAPGDIKSTHTYM